MSAAGKPLSPNAPSWKPNAQAVPFTPGPASAKKAPGSLNPNVKEFVPAPSAAAAARQLSFGDAAAPEMSESAPEAAAQVPLAPKTGEFVYDREFMTQLREKASATVIPEEVRAKLHQLLLKPAGGAGAAGFGSPARRGHGSPGGKRASRGQYNQSNGGRAGGRGRQEADAPVILGPVKPLEKTEDGYMIKRDTTGSEKTLRTLNSILNKLTPEKFDTLLEQALQLEVDSKEMLQEFAITVFEQALVEPNFCPTFAKFSVSLSEALPKFGHDEETRQSAEGAADEEINFKALLLGYCRQEFEKKSDDLPEEQRAGMSPDLLEDARVKLKLRRLAMIRFIGELYVLSLLQGKMIKQCVEQLGVIRDPPDERSLESLCKLWEAVGKFVDRSQDAEDRAWADAQFRHLEVIGAGQQISSRIRFAIKDVVDLRARNWIPRQAQAVQQKLADITDTSKPAAQAAAGKPRGGKEAAARAPAGSANPALRRSGSAFRSSAGSSRYSHFGGPSTGLSRADSGSKAGAAAGAGDWKESSSARRGAQGSFARAGPASPSRFSAGGRSQDVRMEKKKPEAVTTNNPFALLGFGDEEEESEEDEADEAEDQETEADEAEEAQEKQAEDSAEAGESQDAEDDLEGLEGLEDDEEEEVDPEFEKVKKAARSLVREFFQSRDSQEALLCVEELPTNRLNSLLVSVAIAETAETCKPDMCRLGAQLISGLMASDKGLLTLAQADEGIQSQMDRWREIEVDMPLFMRYLGVFVSVLVQKKQLPSEWFIAALERLAPEERSFKLLGPVLGDLFEHQGKAGIAELLPGFESREYINRFLAGSGGFAAFAAEYQLEELFA